MAETDEVPSNKKLESHSNVTDDLSKSAATVQV